MASVTETFLIDVLSGYVVKPLTFMEIELKILLPKFEGRVRLEDFELFVCAFGPFNSLVPNIKEIKDRVTETKVTGQAKLKDANPKEENYVIYPHQSGGYAILVRKIINEMEEWTELICNNSKEAQSVFHIIRTFEYLLPRFKDPSVQNVEVWKSVV